MVTVSDKHSGSVLIPLNPALIAQYEERCGLSRECLSLSDDCSYRPNGVMVSLAKLTWLHSIIY